MTLSGRSFGHPWISASLVSAFVLGLALLGCGGAKTPQAIQQETVQKTMESIPPWFPAPPADAEHLYGTGTGESGDMQFAVNKAEQAARVQITSNIEAKVSSLFKTFSEETGVGQDAEFISMSTGVSKTVASEVISGTRIKDQKIVPEGGRYRAYVLMEMAIGEAQARLQAQIKAQNRLYTQFRASQGYQELEKEVEAFEEFKSEQGAGAAPQ